MNAIINTVWAKKKVKMNTIAPEAAPYAVFCG